MGAAIGGIAVNPLIITLAVLGGIALVGIAAYCFFFKR